MSRFTKHLIAAALSVSFVVMSLLLSSRQSVAQSPHAGSAPVTIVNPVPLPVTVTGSSTVSGTVAATQSGPWNVGITGTPLQVQDVDNTARTPFQQILQTGVSISFTVPSTERLVIEYVSFSCRAAGSAPPLIAIGLETTVSGQFGVHFFAPIKTAFDNNETFFAGGQQTRIYADPGTDVRYFFNAGGVSPLCAVTVSGFLMPV